MQIVSNAESIELKTSSGSAVIVAEGLRSWTDASGKVLISRGPRFKASSEKLGRLRVVPDRLGVVDGCAETHAVVLAKLCRTEEMELTQKWCFTPSGDLAVELEFIVPPACAGLSLLGVELDFPGEKPDFLLETDGGTVTYSPGFDGGIASVLFQETPVNAGIRRMKLVFIAGKNTDSV